MAKVTWHNAAAHALAIRLVGDAGASYVVEVPVGGTIDIDAAYTSRIKSISPHLSQAASATATASKTIKKAKAKAKAKTATATTAAEAAVSNGDN